MSYAYRRLDPLPTTIRLVEPTPEIPVNAAAQKKVANGITIAEKKLTEFEQIYNFTTDSQLRHDMHVKIADLRAQIKSNKDKIIQLKRNAEYTQKCKEKLEMDISHFLEYYDLLKIPGYDLHCPSLDQTTYSRLCCSECNKYFPTLSYLTNHK